MRLTADRLTLQRSSRADGSGFNTTSGSSHQHQSRCRTGTLGVAKMGGRWGKAPNWLSSKAILSNGIPLPPHGTTKQGQGFHSNESPLKGGGGGTGTTDGTDAIFYIHLHQARWGAVTTLKGRVRPGFSTEALCLRHQQLSTMEVFFCSNQRLFKCPQCLSGNLQKTHFLSTVQHTFSILRCSKFSKNNFPSNMSLFKNYSLLQAS